MPLAKEVSHVHNNDRSCDKQQFDRSTDLILLIDNYDSFVHNLARYIRRLGCETMVIRNDAATVEELRRLHPAAVVISPGPCTPKEAGISVAAVRTFMNDTPILGVCLGHQAIVEAFGGTIVRAAEPFHGRTSEITHHRQGIFADVPSPTTVCRYHSLVAEITDLPSELVVTAQTDDQIIMAIEHRDLPVFGLQFHPEAILTTHGYQLLRNFLRISFPDQPLPLPIDEGPHQPVDSIEKERRFPTF